MKKIAIPVKGDLLSEHFGHADHFAIYDTYDGKIIKHTNLVPPPHAPGVIPQWLAEIKINLVLVGGIGQKAIDAFNGKGVDVISGVRKDSASKLIEQYLSGNLEYGMNLCDH